MNNVITRTAQLRSVDVETRTAEFVISTEAVDSYGTVFRMNGWDLSKYNLNPIVTYNHSLHSQNPDNIIGTSEVFIEDGKLIGRVIFEPKTINPLADRVAKKVEHGTLKMASVGAIPTKYHFGEKERGEDPDVLYFDRAELIEWSIVPAGANPEAHKRNESDVEKFRSELAKKIEVKEPEIFRGKSAFEAQIIINKNKQK